MSSKHSSVGAANEQTPIHVECCRACASKYQFKLRTTEIVTVLCGRPEQDQPYKAISYVWETALPPQRVALRCSRCSAEMNIPMRDVTKLWSLLACMTGGYSVWLDTMSIDQDDESDKRSQLAVMGDIYRHAQTISVLLPVEDKEAFHNLKRLGVAADTIVKRHQDFGMLYDGPPPPESLEDTENLEELAAQFLAALKEWTENIGQWTYWQRAWTFQEWAMAREIEIRCEASVEDEGLWNIKNVIVMATTIVVHWKKLQGKDRSIFSPPGRLFDQIQVQERYGKYLHLARAHFPFEDLLIGEDEDTLENLRRETFSPLSMTLPVESSIALRSRNDPDLRFRTLLSLALNAMSMSKRIATNPADKVACWASMCNIAYEYCKDDHYDVALHKVVTVLRQRGLPIFNWLANTNSAEVDVQFLDYAAAQRQSNAANQPYYVGTPVFIGRVDTVIHVKRSLMHNGVVTHLDGNASVTLHQVDRVIIKRPVNWSDKPRALSTFRSVVSGKADGRTIFDVADVLQKEVEALELQQLGKKLLVTVSIGVEDFNSMWYFNAWAICPLDIPLEHMFVARESLNGTLVLAIYKWEEQANNMVDVQSVLDRQVEGDGRSSAIKTKLRRKPATEAQIVAYLNTTHQQNGTYLMKVDEAGIVDVVFRTVDTPQPELFWMPESIESQLDGLHDLIPAISDSVTDMKIKYLKRTLTLARVNREAGS